jgi:hypothetical protein
MFLNHLILYTSHPLDHPSVRPAPSSLSLRLCRGAGPRLSRRRVPREARARLPPSSRALRPRVRRRGGRDRVSAVSARRVLPEAIRGCRGGRSRWRRRRRRSPRRRADAERRRRVCDLRRRNARGRAIHPTRLVCCAIRLFLNGLPCFRPSLAIVCSCITSVST